jgi:hypothetical protein
VFTNEGQELQLVMASISALASVSSLMWAISHKNGSRAWLWFSAAFGIGAAVVFWFVTGDQWPSWVLLLLFLASGIVGALLGRFGFASQPRPDIRATPDPETIQIRTLDVQLENADQEGITYKRKLRVVLQNVGDSEIIVGPQTAWSAGSLRTRHIPEHVWELEPKNGWYSWSWSHKEAAELRVPPGRAFRTWVGLHDNATQSEIAQLRGNLGTLRIPIRVVGRSSDNVISV